MLLLTIKVLAPVPEASSIAEDPMKTFEMIKEECLPKKKELVKN
jgi:hypothetical protein